MNYCTGVKVNEIFKPGTYDMSLALLYVQYVSVSVPEAITICPCNINQLNNCYNFAIAYMALIIDIMDK